MSYVFNRARSGVEDVIERIDWHGGTFTVHIPLVALEGVYVGSVCRSKIGKFMKQNKTPQ